MRNNELKIVTTLLNEDEQEMPVSFGFHPYFLRKELDAKLTIPSENTIEVNGVMIPTGKLSPKENKWNFIEDKVSLENVSFDDGFQDLKLNENKQAVFAFGRTPNGGIQKTWKLRLFPCVCIHGKRNQQIAAQ